MSFSPDSVSAALFHSLIDGPLLLGDLPESPAFPNGSFGLPRPGTALNFEQKLGHLYEDALACLLEVSMRYDLLHQNLQLVELGGRTIGELDYILEDLISGELIHLELAVKFYLAVESDQGLRLPGPDPRDDYFSKLKKMRTHQLVLTRNHGDLLPPEYYGRSIRSRQLVYGCLFDYIHSSKVAEPEFLHPNARRGKWLHVSECADYFGSDANLETIPKPLWPVPLGGLDGIQLEKWEVDPALDRCLMVRARRGGVPYFIAPDGYPDEGR